MPYLEPLPQWESPGVEPPAQLKSEGWRYTQRPPASYFDWFFSTAYFALKELQEQAIHQERIVNNTSTADATKVASANAVKSAFDRAVSGESAAKTYADTKIAALVDSAPGTLDTLNELAAALNNDPNFATTITNLIAEKYSKPAEGIPLDDLAAAIRTSLNKADTALQSVPNASISTVGIVKLNNTVTSTSQTEAATANAVKTAMDRAVSGESAAKTYADTKIAALVDSAPGTLDTLNELAAALNDDPNFATTITNLIATKIASSEKGIASGVATLGTDGKVPLTQLPDGTTTAKGVLQLNNTVTSTSTTQAATANSVKTAMDRADAAFTQANDIKTKWASVVGSPLLSTDTQAQLEAKTQSIKNNIVAKIVAKGGEAVGTESLTSLVNKLIDLVP